MDLKPEKIKEFARLHEGLADFEKYSEDEVIKIANGVANYYLTLFKIHQRIKNHTAEQANNSMDGVPLRGG